MKTIQTIFLVVVLGVACLGLTTSTVSAQSIDGDSLQTHELQWLMRNGFNTHSYDWQDEEINFHLGLGIKERNAGNSLLAGAVAGYVLSMVLTTAGAYTAKPGLAIAGVGAIVGGSVCTVVGLKKKINGKSQVLMATGLKNK